MDEFNEIILELKDHFHKMDRVGNSLILQRGEDAVVPSGVVASSDGDSQEEKSESCAVLQGEDLSSGVGESVVDEVGFSDLKTKIESCRKCDLLVKDRTNVVFGAGNPNADLMFIGEAPGRDEDLQGVPFVGRAGQLLTKILQSIKIKREDVFIANILKCRPPNNRNPLPDEIDNCIDYLLKQIDLIKPKVICALGAVATKTLLKTDKNISSMRGQKLKFHNVTFIPTYHPSYLLRSPYMKKTMWNDMLVVKKVLSE